VDMSTPDEFAHAVINKLAHHGVLNLPRFPEAILVKKEHEAQPWEFDLSKCGHEMQAKGYQTKQDLLNLLQENVAEKWPEYPEDRQFWYTKEGVYINTGAKVDEIFGAKRVFLILKDHPPNEEEWLDVTFQGRPSMIPLAPLREKDISIVRELRQWAEDHSQIPKHRQAFFDEHGEVKSEIDFKRVVRLPHPQLELREVNAEPQQAPAEDEDEPTVKAATARGSFKGQSPLSPQVAPEEEADEVLLRAARIKEGWPEPRTPPTEDGDQAHLGKQANGVSNNVRTVTLTVTLIRDVPGGKLGFGFTEERGIRYFVINRVDKGGVLDRWNKEHPSAEVSVGDMIVSVNNLNYPAMDGMEGQLAHARRVVMTVQKQS